MTRPATISCALLCVALAACSRAKLASVDERADGAIEGAVVKEASVPAELLSEVTKVVRRAAPCLSSSSGSVSVRVTIAGDHLTHASVRADSPLPPAVESCIVEKVERAAVQNAGLADTVVEVALASE